MRRVDLMAHLEPTDSVDWQKQPKNILLKIQLLKMLTLEIEKRLHLEYIRIFKGGVDICKGNIQNQFMYVFVVSCDMKKKTIFLVGN